jgi:DNA replication protein DnaC
MSKELIGYLESQLKALKLKGMLTHYQNFDEWGEIFSDQVVAAAIIDRLVHHAHIFYINGTSYRLKGKLRASTDY